ncbi:efflux RND transporter periplasmic adaptor subunit [Sphingomonas sp. H39-1-10]|uniref:efflux RND transporter periplasmic adaptor subunit n=1 Tax=Sphingomonas pollutisoli TaxID=3030829 RepID=UPI0023B89DC9|nr:efflux RND transporter periplasmic adaptor subunit [Sphingomonas pollutisoli]MDF0488266.1 efflux RND transporter periplasmic adaptor subunit [Sphingomonas pollutisoli]
MNYETPLLDNGGTLALPAPEAERGYRRTLVIGAVIAIVGALVLGWWWMHSHPGAKPAAVEQLPSVTVSAPGRSNVAAVISATGTLAAKRDMPVGVAGEGGMITRVLVEPGQWVGKGQVLATIDRAVQTQTGASLAAQVRAARADAGIAQSNYDRALALVDRGFISKADLEQKAATRDAALARVKVAQASLDEQLARNGRLDIRAPEAGLILARGVEAGQIVGASSGTLFRMAERGEMEMRAQLSEGDLAAIHVGSPATVRPVGSNVSYSGTVWQVSPVIDTQTRQGIARIALSYNPALRPGGFAAAEIGGGSTSAPLLPNSAIQSDDRGNFVYVLDANDKVVRRDVKVGEVSDNGVAIAEGLSGSERVVLSAGAFLAPGQKVKPILQKPLSQKPRG